MVPCLAACQRVPCPHRLPSSRLQTALLQLIDGMEQKGGPLDLQEEFSLPLAFKV